MDQNVFEKIFKEHIKIETSQKSIESLFSLRNKNKTVYDPYYQRNYVWDYSKATHFIESVFLGTELPPLIFFENEEKGIEIIDGRQRYETLDRFINDDFALRDNGLTVLTELKNLKFSSLGKSKNDLLELFYDCKIRLIHFQIVNHPPLEKELQDKVKKEIFLRYNSGITPLKKEEVDDARYDKDSLTNFFKKKLQTQKTRSLFESILFTGSDEIYRKTSVAKIMSQVRVELVLPMYPIEQFSKGGVSKIIEKLYEFYITNVSSDNENKIIYDKFYSRLEILQKVLKYSKRKELKLNHLALRSLLWSFGVIEKEGQKILNDKGFIASCSNFINDNIEYFSTEYSTRRENIYNRHIITQQFIEDHYKIDFNPYVKAQNEITNIKKELKNKEPKTKLEDLNNMGLSKQEPSNMSIEDVIRKMNRNKFLVRPSYQRVEVIDVQKKSSIIESVLLNIKLPPIFIFKRNDDVYEVVDGQQRLLTLLGFTGECYKDLDNKLIKSKDHNFKLKGLRILSDLNGKSFNSLDNNLQDKLLDFQLYVVEIDSKKNANFDQIDLFIRLNDKPYPIKTNSFEMWNSWVDVEIIEKIKKLKNELYPWFYIKKISKKSDRDRMENEELITSLCYIENYDDLNSVLDYYQKDNIDINRVVTSKLTARVKTKSRINSMMLEFNNSSEAKEKFLKSIKKVKSVIKILKLILIDRNPTSKEEDMNDFLKVELDKFIVVGNSRKLQNFYFLWILIHKSNFNLVKYKRHEIKRELIAMFKFISAEHTGLHKDNNGKTTLRGKFKEQMELFHKNYTQTPRKKRLSLAEKEELLNAQKGKSGLSTATVFMWDDFHVDHIEPLSIGGKDEIENMQITHGKENQKKGPRK